MVLINGTVLADKTAFRKLEQITLYRQIGREIDRFIDRIKAAKQKGRSIVNMAALTNLFQNTSDKYTKKWRTNTNKWHENTLFIYNTFFDH